MLLEQTTQRKVRCERLVVDVIARINSELATLRLNNGRTPAADGSAADSEENPVRAQKRPREPEPVTQRLDSQKKQKGAEPVGHTAASVQGKPRAEYDDGDPVPEE